MNDPTEAFIRTYEQIHAEVNRRAGDPTSHFFEIKKAAECDAVVSRNSRLLTYIKDVRNALQHPQHGSEGPAVQVSESFLDEAKAVLRYLKAPPTAKSVGVPRKEIKAANMTDRLGDLADEIKQKGFSHVPILDEDSVVIGVFNEAAVFDHLWADEVTIISRDMQISDIFPHCRLDADHTEKFRFVSPRKSVDNLVDIFLALESPTTRVGAVFVTASGKKTEPINRLITPWDVMAVSSN